MTRRVPASVRTRESLSDLIEGRLSSAAGRAELVKLATRLIVEEALEAESRDALGRDYYEHGASAGQGWRNGVRMGRLKTAEGLVDYAAPQIAGREEPFRSEIRENLKGRTQALEDLAVEMLARGLSVRDIEDAFRDESGRLLLSRTAASEIGERLWADYQEFATRDLGEYDIAYLFVDGIAERIRPGQRRRAGTGGLGLHGDRRQGPAAPDGRLQGGRGDGERLLSEHAHTRPRRSAADGLGRCGGHHQGDRDLLPALGTPALPRPSYAQPGGQGAGRPLARVQGAHHRCLPGPLPRHRPRSRQRCGRRLPGRAAQRERLLRGRLRGLHRASAHADHRTERGHDRLRRHRDPEPALPVPLDPGSAIVPVLDDGAHDIASELVRGLTHPQLDLLGRLGARLETKLLATQCEHPGGRLDDPRRQAGKIDGRRRRRRGYWHGNAPDVGFRDTASYRFWRCGAFPPSPARPCRRDKILPWSGPLSRIAVFGRPSRHQNHTKSMTYIFHTRPTPSRSATVMKQLRSAWYQNFAPPALVMSA